MPGISVSRIPIPFKGKGGFNWSSYWNTLISATVENAAPTHVVLTFPAAQTSLVAADFTIAGFTIASASWTGAVLTLVLSSPVTVFVGDLTITFVTTSQTATVTNNVDDGHTVAWYDSSDLSTITKDGSDFVSLWEDKLGSGLDLAQATGSLQPKWVLNDGILFDGTDDRLKTAQLLSMSQPTKVYLIVNQIAWENYGGIMDGYNNDTGILYHQGSTPEIKIRTNGNLTTGNTTNIIGSFVILRLLFNGANSEVRVNDLVATGGNAGTFGMGGITFGSNDASAGFANFKIKEAIFRDVDDDAETEEAIYAYLTERLFFLNLNQYLDYREDTGVVATSKRICAINGKYRLAAVNFASFVFSSDNGDTWGVPFAWAVNGDIYRTMAHITNAGAVLIFDSQLNKIWRSTNGCVSFTQITPTDISGDPIVPHVPANVTYPGTYYTPFTPVLEAGGVLLWGNYGNAIFGAAPTRIFYSTDDGVTIKTLYEFGRNANYTDNGTAAGGVGGTLLGNAGNAKITRHVHGCSYNQFTGKYYCFTGDSTAADEIHIIELEYNSTLDTWSVSYLIEGGSQLYRVIQAGFDVDGYMYYGCDGEGEVINGYAVDGIHKVKISELSDVSKFTRLKIATRSTFGFYKDGDILINASNGSGILDISGDKGVTWSSIDLTELCTFNSVAWIPPHNIYKDDRGNYLAVNRQCVGGGVYVNILV